MPSWARLARREREKTNIARRSIDSTKTAMKMSSWTGSGGEALCKGARDPRIPA